MWRFESPRVSMPRTERPRAIRLKVSQLPVSAMRMRPPLGASGFTQSKCSKSGGSFGSPRKA